MKKNICIAAALLSMLSISSNIYAKNVTYPGFHDQFNITLNDGVIAQINYQGQQGTIYNDPDPTSLYCSGNLCHFTITDDNSWDSSGSVSYLIGDQTQQGPFCLVTIADGALLQEATLTSQCANGATATQLLHNDNQYQFSIN